MGVLANLLYDTLTLQSLFNLSTSSIAFELGQGWLGLGLVC